MAAFGNKLATTPPHPRESKNEVTKETLFERFAATLMPAANRYSIMLLFSLESLLITLKYIDIPGSGQIYTTFCPTNALLKDIVTITPLFLMGAMSALSGAGLRLWCFRALGRLFTFDMTIRQDHKLIDSGPYALVRHPSYTAYVLIWFGVLSMALGPHSYIQACGIASTTRLGFCIVCGWATFLTYVAYSLLRRGKIEDAKLKQEFGKQWESYAQRVPYRFFPGIA